MQGIICSYNCSFNSFEPVRNHIIASIPNANGTFNCSACSSGFVVDVDVTATVTVIVTVAFTVADAVSLPSTVCRVPRIEFTNCITK